MVVLSLATVLVVCLVCGTILVVIHAPDAATIGNSLGNIAAASLGALIVMATKVNGNGRTKPEHDDAPPP